MGSSSTGCGRAKVTTTHKLEPDVSVSAKPIKRKARCYSAFLADFQLLNR